MPRPPEPDLGNASVGKQSNLLRSMEPLARTSGQRLTDFGLRNANARPAVGSGDPQIGETAVTPSSRGVRNAPGLARQ